MQEFFLHYNLTELLAAKTLRSVYLAHPLRETQHKFIVKIFDKECAGQNQEAGLAQAARLMALNHPHIVPIVDIALEEQGKPYVISNYCVHGSLRQRLERLTPEHMDWQEAISTVIQIGQALSYAHNQNVIHGNMKPENVFYNNIGEVQLTDFNLAPFIDIAKLEYKSDLYTMRYMAPEQFMGKTDQQSDQYALACLAYELVTGHTPFKAQSFSSMWGKHATEFAAPLSTHVPKIPMSIDLAILKALAKKPESRYVDIAAFLTALGTGLASHTSGLPLSLISSTVTNIVGNTPLPTTIANSNASTSDTNKVSPTEQTENTSFSPGADLLQSQSGISRNLTDPISQSGVPRNSTGPISYADLSETATDSTDAAFLAEKTQTNPIGVTPIPKLPTPSGIRLHIEDNQHQLASEVETDVPLREPMEQATTVLQIHPDPNYANIDSNTLYTEPSTRVQDKVHKPSEINLRNNDQIPPSIYAPLPQHSKHQHPLRLWISVISAIIILAGFFLPYFLSHMPNHSIINSGQNNKDITKDTVSHATTTARATTIVLQPALQPKPISPTPAKAIPVAPKASVLPPTTTSTVTVSKNPTAAPPSAPIVPTATPMPHGTGSVQIDAGGSGAGSFVADEDYSNTFPDRPSSDSSISDPINTSGVSNPAPASVYQSVRLGDTLYTIANLTPKAPYNVRLHFAETYWTQAGIRTFNVAINGQQVLSNFDIFAAAGAKDKAVVEQFTITPTVQGTISIQFTTVHNNAEVSGIEVLAI